MDIAVIGAGPAGAWAACRLARLGARVTIFDASHPREKPCGGGVTGRAFSLVRGTLSGFTVGATPITSARFTIARRDRQAVVPLDGGALAVADRATFDAALLDAAIAAGATLVTSRVVDVSASPAISVRTRDQIYTADYLVGDDGANSLVRRRLAHPFTRAQLSVATGCFARGVTSAEIVIGLTRDPPGYLWSFPRPDHLAIGVCAQADADATGLDRLRKHCADWIDASRLTPPGCRLDWYSWPIPSLAAGDFHRQAIAGPRWCLVGDAAGLVDPITREGIYFAIASGGWAADAIAADPRPTDAYVDRVRDEAYVELAAAARLKAGFFRPAFTSLLIEALDNSSAIRSVMPTSSPAPRATARSDRASSERSN
jgi:geranylgeranyl reductase family protein